MPSKTDHILVEAVLLTMPLLSSVATEEDPQHLCADKGYDYDYTRFLIAGYGHYTPIKSRGDEKAAKTHIPGCRARR